MKNYIKVVYNTSIPQSSTVRVKDSLGRETGAGFVKSNEFLFLDFIKDLIGDLKGEISTYAKTKKNLPKVDKDSSSITYRDAINAIRLASNGYTHDGIPLDFWRTDLSSNSKL